MSDLKTTSLYEFHLSKHSKMINFMAKHGRGLICLALTKKQVDFYLSSLMLCAFSATNLQ
ncbi:MAG: hypothetical protein EBX23_03170 [Proteobacteria bacterium]|nr:hypothetical protein [Pseudomonadota bacterium]